MDAIEFQKEGIVLIEESFGGLDESRLEIKYSNLGDYEVELEGGERIPLDQIVSTGTSQAPRINFAPIQRDDAEIRKRDAERESDPSESTVSVPVDRRPERMPPVPNVESFKTDTDQKFYNRLKANPDSQPAVYRRIIREAGKIVRYSFDASAENHGFDPSGGSHNASLLVLDRVTGEIERRGSGDNQLLVWVNG